MTEIKGEFVPSAADEAMPTAQQVVEIAEEFFRDGCVLIPNIFTAAEVAALRAKTDEYALNPDPQSKHTSYAGNAFVLRYCHEIDPLFQAMTTRPAIRRIVEAILGANAKFNAMNVIRNGPGQAISRWHVDDVLEFPLPPDIPRFDARIRMPVCG
ncbi:MAG: phytanoyl-CoA dioxygenase family protein [Leptolyngbyaceae cyanobacterium CSU_1_3]|nr:phytanoyl-CoA dioxygenase family protein [Leptolyngbyaceae cyanobacterium CSU_1_3]